MKTRFPVLAALLTAGLSGCASVSEYRPPAAEVPAAFSMTSQSSKPGELASWWRGFRDPVLDGLIARALAGDLDVKRAAVRIEQARQEARIAGAANQPTLSADTQASITRLSRNSSLGALAAKAGQTGGGLGSAGLPGDTIKTFQLGFDAGWELDLFGGVRREVEAAEARVEAAVWSRRDAELMLAAEVTRNYLAYRAIQRRRLILDEKLRVEADALDYRRVRLRNGLATVDEVSRAEADLAADTASLRGLIAQRDAQGHALAVLVGQPPLALDAELAALPPGDAAETEIPTGLPSELLRRRPDIRLAERQLAAATAEVGVARADLYPRISLTGAASLVSSSLSNLIESDSGQPSAGAALSAPLLDGGRRRATVKLRQAQADEAALAYRATTLSALREVEDALTRIQADHDRRVQLTAAETAAREALAAVRARRQAGLANEIEALQAETVVLVASDAVIQLRAETNQDLVALAKALGGGWDEKEAS